LTFLHVVLHCIPCRWSKSAETSWRLNKIDGEQAASVYTAFYK